MSKYDFDLGVIGGGAGGLTAAAGASQLGAKVLLVEREPSLGGDCLHFGCVPSKALIACASNYSRMKNAADWGLPKVAVPPPDFGKIALYIKGVIEKIQKHDSVERFCGLGVQVQFGKASFVDEHKVSAGEKSFSAKKWVIATGSSAFIPPISGLEQTPFLTNREIFSLPSLPESLIILGGGPIGVEMAQAFCRLGTKVTVVEMAGQILGPEDPDMADIVLETLRNEGVEFYLSSRAVKVEDLKGRCRVTVEKPSGEKISLAAEKLLVAVGRSVNVQNLGLEKAGVNFSPRGIGVDNRCRTSQPHIFAVGDVSGGYQFTHAAGYEGGVALVNAVMHLPRKVDYTWMPWCTYTDPELASVGLNEKRAKATGIDYSIFEEKFSNNDRSLAGGGATGKIKLLLGSNSKLLGVQIAGPHAGELINQWVAVANGKVKLSTLASAIHPYPTLGEINKRVAGAIYAPKLYSGAIKKTLKVLFGLKGRACGPDMQ
ncbi:MAG: FAD-dependent oxidoreductase [Desulfatibacillaceae bacterium]|nr:FAD-dependent oxidoreductase [Desulfatibacillaceae bacterium]